MSPVQRSETWPSLPLSAWQESFETLHLWTQVVGKIRLALSSWVNHSWHVTLYVTPRGLTTGPIPHDSRTFQIDFDFIDHRLVVIASDGGSGAIALEPQSCATFYGKLMAELDRMRLHVRIGKMPNEVSDPIAFDRDQIHCAYDPDYANRFWRILLQADRIFRIFRSFYSGKCSPVHFFWGAADLAVTRFSGRRAPRHPGGIPGLPDWITRDAYSDEVSSCGFWPGGGAIDYPAFYSYAYPESAGFPQTKVMPAEAFYSGELREFILPYDAVWASPSPDETLLAFLQSTYEAAANLGHWDRGALERGRPKASSAV